MSTLTPEGARLLRAARDQILVHPETFDMGLYECGTRACIAGHVARVMGEPLVVCGGFERTKAGVRRVAERLGFGGELTQGADGWVAPSLLPLFGNFGTHDTPELARDAINAFLWKYGYPADELAPEAPTDVGDLVGA